MREGLPSVHIHIDRAGQIAYPIIGDKTTLYTEKTMNERTEISSEAAYVPVNVLDNEAYVKLNEPTVKEFGNAGKDINKINVTYSHNVVDHYKRSV